MKFEKKGPEWLSIACYQTALSGKPQIPVLAPAIFEVFINDDADDVDTKGIN